MFKRFRFGIVKVLALLACGCAAGRVRGGGRRVDDSPAPVP